MIGSKLVVLCVLLACASSVKTLKPLAFLQEADKELSDEILNWIMSDVNNGISDPADAYYNIGDMVDDGTLVPEDGQAAMDSLIDLMAIDAVTATDFVDSEDAYDGNIYMLEDTTLGEEIVLEIIEDVASGEVTTEQAISQLAVMVEDEWISEEEYVWGSEEVLNVEPGNSESTSE